MATATVEYPNWTFEDMTGDFEIRTLPNPVLRQVAGRVEKNEFGPELQAFGEKMIAFMVQCKGVGLAANQIGLLKRIFVMETDTGYEAVINPVLIPGYQRRGMTLAEEGCLSIPGLSAEVARYNQIALSYQTPTGKKRRVTLQGFRARIAQHENDHLQEISVRSAIRLSLLSIEAKDEYIQLPRSYGSILRKLDSA